MSIFHTWSVITLLTLFYLIGKRKKIPGMNECDKIGIGLEIIRVQCDKYGAHQKIHTNMVVQIIFKFISRQYEPKDLISI